MVKGVMRTSPTTPTISTLSGAPRRPNRIFCAIGDLVDQCVSANLRETIATAAPSLSSCSVTIGPPRGRSAWRERSRAWRRL
jgi:hypothetical protein